MVLFYGLAVVIDVVNLRATDPLSYLALVNILIGIILLLLFPKAIKQLKIVSDKNFLKKMLPLSGLALLKQLPATLL